MIKLKSNMLINYFNDGIYRYDEMDSFAYEHMDECILVIKNNRIVEQCYRFIDISNKEDVSYACVKRIYDSETNIEFLSHLTENESKIEFDFLNKTAIFLFKKPNLTTVTSKNICYD